MGGCVRDLILKRTPRDFDILTSAELREVAPPFSSLIVSTPSTQAYFIFFAFGINRVQVVRTFSRCEIVGRRFPICHVHVGDDDIVEVCLLFLTFQYNNSLCYFYLFLSLLFE